MKKTKKGISKGKVVAGVAGVVAISAGAYYLFGPDAKKHQKKASALLLKMKKEVQTEIKKAKEVSTPIYNKAVDVVSKNYAKQYKLHGKDVKAFASKLKSEWKGVKKIVKKTVKGLKK